MPIEQTSHIMTISVGQIFSEFETGDRKENDSLLGPFQLLNLIINLLFKLSSCRVALTQPNILTTTCPSK